MFNARYYIKLSLQGVGFKRVIYAIYMGASVYHLVPALLHLETYNHDFNYMNYALCL
jgi:hypothetical protein